VIEVVMEGDDRGGLIGRRNRQAAEDLLRRAAGRRDISVALQGGRSKAAKEYAGRLASGSTVLLLVDAESAVSSEADPWAHLAEMRDGNAITRPNGAPDAGAHLMVIMMETWVLAGIDWPANVRIDQRFRHPASNVEGLKKQTVERDSDAAMPERQKQTALSRLADIDPERLARKAPHARRLFDHLRSLT
jgi:hypothetical protein